METIATGPSIDTVRHQITIPGTSFCAVVDPERVDVSKLLKKLATASGLRATRKADRDRMPVVTVLQPGDVAAPAQGQTTDTATAVPASQLTPWRATYSRKSLGESVTALRIAYPGEFEYEELDGVEDDVADVAAPAQDVAADVPAPESTPRRPVRSREQVAAEMHARTMERAAKEAQRCAAEAEERAVAAEERAVAAEALAAEAVRRAEALELELRCSDDAPAAPAVELTDALARAEAAEERADALAAELATVCAETADDVERAAAEAGARAEAGAADAWAVAVADAEERAVAVEDRMRAAEARAVALRDAAEDAERAAADAVAVLEVRAGRRAVKRARMAARPVAPAPVEVVAPVAELEVAAPVAELEVAPVAPAPVAAADVEDVAPVAVAVEDVAPVEEVAPAAPVEVAPTAPVVAPVVEVAPVASRPVVARLGRVLGLLVVLVVVGAWAAVAVVARAVRAAATRAADLEAARGGAPVVATRPVPVAVAPTAPVVAPAGGAPVVAGGAPVVAAGEAAPVAAGGGGGGGVAVEQCPAGALAVLAPAG